METTFSKALRDLADWLDANPDFVPEYHDAALFLKDGLAPSDIGRCAMALGLCGKDSYNGDYILKKDWGGGLQTSFWFPKTGICKRVVTGTKTVTKEIPDPSAPMLTVTDEVETFEWVCPDSVLEMVR
jgi:hypothetical protein